MTNYVAVNNGNPHSPLPIQTLPGFSMRPDCRTLQLAETNFVIKSYISTNQFL